MANPDTTRASGRPKGTSPARTATVDCLACGGLLFERELIDDLGHWAVPPEKSLPLDNEQRRFFFSCPHCGARNYIAPDKNRFGVPQIRINRCCPA